MDPALSAALEALLGLFRRKQGEDSTLRELILRGERPDGSSVDISLELLQQTPLPSWKNGPPLAVAVPAHSPDFRSVFQDGLTYSLTKSQAAVVAILWAARESHTPDVGDELLLKASGTEQVKLALVFRDSPAWGTLVVEGGTRGVHRLAQPAQP